MARVEVGKGSTFYFTLPMASANLGKIAPPASELVVSKIIEDDEISNNSSLITDHSSPISQSEITDSPSPTSGTGITPIFRTQLSDLFISYRFKISRRKIA